MLRVAVAIGFLVAVATAQNCTENDESVRLVPIVGSRPSSIHYAWIQADTDDNPEIATTIEGAASETAFCLEGCSQLLYAESTWQPHFDRGEETSGLEIVSETGSTKITARRFAKVEFGCEALQCGEDEVLVETYVHIKGEGSVAVQAADAVLMETSSLGYHQSCQPASACTTMCFASTGDEVPRYATGRIIVDGKIVFDKDLEVFDCQGDSAVQVGSCSKAELAVACDNSLLTVEFLTDDNGPYSPYGVSWGLIIDGSKTALSPPNDSNGYESNVVFKETYCISQLECTDFYIDNQYDDGSFRARLLLDDEELRVTSDTKGTATQALTKCSELASDEASDELSGGAIAGIVIALILCCCCFVVAAIVNERYS